MCHFRAQNGPFVMNKIFLVQTIIITFIYLLALFIVQNLKKILTVNPELWGCTIFGPKMVHLPQKIFCKIINIILIYLLTPYPELWRCTIFGPKMAYYWPIWPISNENFFPKTCLWALFLSFMPVYIPKIKVGY